MSRRARKRFMGIFATGILGVGVVLTGAGQMQTSENPASQEGKATVAETVDELKVLQERSKNIEVRLDQIAEEAEEEYPVITEMHSLVMEIYQQKLSEYGYPSREELEELQVMQKRLQAPDKLDDDERQRMTKEFHDKVAKMKLARQEATNDPEVQEALQRQQQAKTAAMTEIDKSTPALQNELAEVKEKIRFYRQRLQNIMQVKPTG